MCVQAQMAWYSPYLCVYTINLILSAANLVLLMDRDKAKYWFTIAIDMDILQLRYDVVTVTVEYFKK